jgi:putative intracellular protease/amidase
MSTIAIPIPSQDFEPAEASLVWDRLVAAGHEVVFATPDGRPGAADPIMLRGAILRWHFWGRFGAPPAVRETYARMVASREFQHPIRYEDLSLDRHLAMSLPGGHAKGLRPYLESAVLQDKVASFVAADRPVAAVCHGVVVLARTKDARTGRSVIEGRKVTALTANLELGAWLATFWFRGNYYRTYPQTVQAEVTAAVGATGTFDPGPFFADYGHPFVVRDGRLVTARWPGDLSAYASTFLEVIAEAAEEATRERPTA